MDSYQLAGYSSLVYPNWFADAVVILGRNSYRLDRPGVMGDLLTAAPNGVTVTAGIKGGYLFDIGTLRLGPIISANYLRTRVDSYVETGDHLLTQYVAAQQVERFRRQWGAVARSLLGWRPGDKAIAVRVFTPDASMEKVIFVDSVVSKTGS